MPSDFTIKVYQQLLHQIADSGYSFQTYEEYIKSPKKRVVVLRHDVDRIPKNAMVMARLERSLGINSTYYFRVVRNVWDDPIMREIARLDHEVAYHYEDMSLMRGDPQRAIEHFKYQLNRFREIYPSKTICMHGSPLSRIDNRSLWEHYDYREYGIIAEPYFDTDFSQTFYITDTGRKWNLDSVSVRDRVSSCFDIRIHSTMHMIWLLKKGKLPDHIMINTHPHRWFDGGLGWYRELMMQNIKNMIKFLLVKGGLGS